MNAKRTTQWTIGLVTLMGVVLAWATTEPGDKNFTGTVNLEGDWQVKGTKVTSTAAQINELGAATVTTATSISNINLRICASNVSVKPSGTFDLQSGASATLSGSITATGLAAISNINNTLTVSNILVKPSGLADVKGTLTAIGVSTVSNLANAVSTKDLWVTTKIAVGTAQASKNDGITCCLTNVGTAGGLFITNVVWYCNGVLTNSVIIP